MTLAPIAPGATAGAGGGLQEVPCGHGDAFTGKAFVFSGVLPSLFRDAAQELVLKHGGRVTGGRNEIGGAI